MMQIVPHHPVEQKMKKSIILVSTVILSLLTTIASFCASPSGDDVRAAMRRASAFMVDEVSCNGGYLWTYAADFSRRWGEAPARKSQIWVQGGTPDVGQCFLDIYNETGDEYYLECAEKAANALVYGQHHLGGWHYFIDFDITGLDEWYENVFSNYKWGMEEYRHYYGNCTFDDDSTVGPTRFLLNLYMTTLKSEYRAPLEKALDFIMLSQYSNGGWPQRYPLRYEFAHDGFPDYTSYYTFNDEVIVGNIDMLIEAYEKLGDERYMEAARRGMDFIILSQGPEGQEAWADQHGMDLKPATGRTHEHAGYMVRYTRANINALQQYFLVTGDKRYLKPIPGAIEWLKKSMVEKTDDGLYTLYRRYEYGTNLPVFHHRSDKVTSEGYGIWDVDHTPDSSSRTITVDIERIEREYDRLNAMSSEEARAEYKASKQQSSTPDKVDPEEVRRLINALDNRGAWVEDVVVFDMDITRKSPPGVKWDNYNPDVDDDHATRHIQGISTRSFIEHMTLFMHYLDGLK